MGSVAKWAVERRAILAVFDRLDMPAFLLDESGHVIEANRAAVETFMHSSSEMEGQGVRILFDGGESEYSDVVKRSSEGGRPTASLRRKDGERFPAAVTIAPSGLPGLNLMVIEDVTGKVRLERRAFQRNKELSIFTEFSRIVSECSGADCILRELASALPSVMGAGACWIHLSDQSGLLRLKASEGLSREIINRVTALAPGECVSGRVFASGRPVMVENSSMDPRVSRIKADKDDPSAVVSIASVPIMSRGAAMGALSIGGSTASAFTSMDMRMLSVLATHLSVALENSRLIAELSERMRLIGLTNELSSAVNSSLSIGTIFRIMVSEIRAVIGFDRASLLLYDEKKDNLLIFALETQLKTVMPKGVLAPVAGTGAGWAVRHGRPWINRDLKEQIRFPLDEKLYKEGIRSTVSIPLGEEKIIGAFNLDSTEPDKYTDKDLDILMPAARHIAIALGNALLFEEVVREKREWEKTFDAITDMVWTEDINQTVVRANQALLGRIGLSLSQAQGMRCGDILSLIGINSGQRLCKATAQTKAKSFREVQSESGSVFHFWAYPLMDAEGRLYEIVHYLKDVTLEKQLQQQLVRTERLASLGTLSAGIAHEINNPLGIIAGYAGALLDRARSPRLLGVAEFEDFPEYLDTIQNEIFRCKEILGGLLEFSRPHRAKQRELDMNEIIKEVMLLVKHRAKTLNYDMNLMLSGGLPKIHGEAGSLRQMIMNVIMNAMYYTPEGGSITIGTEFDGKWSSGGGMITISVSDTGGGVPEHLMDRIFDPFFTTKPPGDGTGLGLSISHKIAEEHGGFIEARNLKTDGGPDGAVFLIRIPAAARKSAQ